MYCPRPRSFPCLRSSPLSSLSLSMCPLFPSLFFLSCLLWPSLYLALSLWPSPSFPLPLALSLRPSLYLALSLRPSPPPLRRYGFARGCCGVTYRDLRHMRWHGQGGQGSGFCPVPGDDSHSVGANGDDGSGRISKGDLLAPLHTTSAMGGGIN